VNIHVTLVQDKSGERCCYTCTKYCTLGMHRIAFLVTSRNNRIVHAIHVQFIVQSPNFLSLCGDNELYANNSKLLCMHIITNHYTHTDWTQRHYVCTVCSMLKYSESLKDDKTTRNKLVNYPVQYPVDCRRNRISKTAGYLANWNRITGASLLDVVTNDRPTLIMRYSKMTRGLHKL